MRRGIFVGNGKCSQCHGSGTNLNLASDAPQCLFCKGTGARQTCGGDGTFSQFDDGGQSEIQKLFD